MHRGGGGAFGIAAITGGTAQFDNGSASAPSISFANSVQQGFYSRTAAILGVAMAGAEIVSFSATILGLPSNGALGWSGTTDPSGTTDTRLIRATTGTLQLHGTSSAVGASMRRIGGNAGYVEWGSVAENLTLSTGGTTTDTAANLLPADSYIESVTARVTTTVATATSWQLGDATTAAASPPRNRARSSPLARPSSASFIAT
jgi:hypothetical protein